MHSCRLLKRKDISKKHKYKQKATPKQQLTHNNAFSGRQVAEFRTQKITVRKRCEMTVVKFRTKI